jgi:hypothetical protein
MVTQQQKEAAKTGQWQAIKNLKFDDLVQLIPSAIEGQQLQVIKNIATEAARPGNSVALQKMDPTLRNQILQQLSESKAEPDFINYIADKLLTPDLVNFTTPPPFEHKDAKNSPIVIANQLFRSRDYLANNLVKFHNCLIAHVNAKVEDANKSQLYAEDELKKATAEQKLFAPLGKLQDVVDGKEMTTAGKRFTEKGFWDNEIDFKQPYFLIKNQFVRACALARIPACAGTALSIANNLIRDYQPELALEVLKRINPADLKEDAQLLDSNNPNIPYDAKWQYAVTYQRASIYAIFDKIANDYCNSSAKIDALSGPQILRRKIGSFLFRCIAALEGRAQLHIRDADNNIRLEDMAPKIGNIRFAIYNLFHGKFLNPAVDFKKSTLDETKPLDLIESLEKQLELLKGYYATIAKYKDLVIKTAAERKLDKTLLCSSVSSSDKDSLFMLEKEAFNTHLEILSKRCTSARLAIEQINVNNIPSAQMKNLGHELCNLDALVGTLCLFTLLPTSIWQKNLGTALDENFNKHTERDYTTIIAHQLAFLANFELFYQLFSKEAQAKTFIDDMIPMVAPLTDLNAQALSLVSKGLDHTIPQILKYIHEQYENILMLNNRLQPIAAFETVEDKEKKDTKKLRK